MSNFILGCKRQQTPLENKPFNQWVLPNESIWASFYRANAGYLLRFPELADFSVSADGRSVRCHPVPGESEDTIQHLYLNQVLPLTLSLQGKLVFHGSAVEVGETAVAFVAETGRGKSTLAASFASNGFRFLTDDGLVVEPCGEGYLVFPSHPSIRLWDDSEEALLSAGVEKAPALSYTAKSRFLAGSDIVFCRDSRPLRRVFFLGSGNTGEIEITSLSGAESMVKWVKHSFLLDIDNRSNLASHFEMVAELANQQIHFRLDFPRHYDRLTSVRQVIVQHIFEEEKTL